MPADEDDQAQARAIAARDADNARMRELAEKLQAQQDTK